MKLIKNQEYDSSITFWDTLFTEEKLRIIASQILGVDVDDISTQEDSPSQFNQFKFELLIHFTKSINIKNYGILMKIKF
jgi:bifunctional ADP-heptose synthase (sugar kinase/adenylyltransferase)